jgi:hypothetical protein
MPSVIYSPTRKRYEGPYVSFVQRFAGSIADHIASQIRNAQQPFWRDLIKTLRTIEVNGTDDLARSSQAVKKYAQRIGSISDGLEALAKNRALEKWSAALGSKVDLHALVFDILTHEGDAFWPVARVSQRVSYACARGRGVKSVRRSGIWNPMTRTRGRESQARGSTRVGGRLCTPKAAKPSLRRTAHASSGCRRVAQKVDGGRNESDGGHHLGETAHAIRPNRHAMLSV